MTRSTSAALLAAALALAACGGDDQHAATPPADSAATATPNLPGAIGGAPARAQVAADSSNAAVARRDADVDALSREASGAGAAPTTTP